MNDFPEVPVGGSVSASSAAPIAAGVVVSAFTAQS
jgi:hypothetical protein